MYVDSTQNYTKFGSNFPLRRFCFHRDITYVWNWGRRVTDFILFRWNRKIAVYNCKRGVSILIAVREVICPSLSNSNNNYCIEHLFVQISKPSGNVLVISDVYLPVCHHGQLMKCTWPTPLMICGKRRTVEFRLCDYTMRWLYMRWLYYAKCCLVKQ